MAGTADLAIVIRAKDDASRTIERIQGSMGRFGGLAKTALGVGAAIGGIAVAVGGVAGAFQGLRTAANLEQVALTFETLLGSTEAAQQRIKELTQFAAKTPFELPGIIEADRLLQTFGARSVENLKLVGDAAAGVSQPIEEVAFWFGRAATAIQAGRPFGEAAARLQEMGLLSGPARSKLEDLTKAGASSTEVMAALSGELGRFGGLMEKQSTTLNGLVSTFKDTINLLLGSLAKPFLPLAKRGLSAAINLLSNPQVERRLVGFAERAAKGLERFVDTLRDAGRGARRFVGDLVSESGKLNIFATQLALALGVPRGSEELIGFGNTLRAVLDRLLAAAQSFASGFASVLGPDIRQLGEILTRAAGGVTTLGVSLAGNTGQAERFGRAVATILEAWLAFLAVRKVVTLTQEIRRTGAALITGVRNLAHTITQTIKRIGEFIGFLANMAQTITQTVVHAGAKLIEIVPNVAQTITQTVKVKANAASLGVKFGTSFAAGIAQGLGIVLAPLIVVAVAGVSLTAIVIAAAALLLTGIFVAAALRPDVAGKVAGALAAMFLAATIKLPILLVKIAYRLVAAFVGAWLESVKENFRAIGDIIGGIIEGDWGRAAEGGLALLSNSFIGFPRRIAEELGTAFAEIGIDIAAFFADITKLSEVNWGTVGEKFETGMGTIAAFAANWGREFAAGFAATFFEMSGTTEEQWRDIGSKIKGGAEAAAGFAIAAFRFLTQTIPAFVAEMTARAIAKFVELVTWVAGLPGRILSAIGNLGSTLREKGGELMGGLFRGITTFFFNDVRGWLLGIGDRILNAIGDVADLLKQKGKDILGGFWKGVQDAWQTGWDWFTSLGSGPGGAIANLVASEQSKVAMSGRGLMSGFLLGLQRGWSPVRGFLAGLSSQIESAGANVTIAAPLIEAPMPPPIPEFPALAAPKIGEWITPPAPEFAAFSPLAAPVIEELTLPPLPEFPAFPALAAPKIGAWVALPAPEFAAFAPLPAPLIEELRLPPLPEFAEFPALSAPTVAALALPPLPEFPAFPMLAAPLIKAPVLPPMPEFPTLQIPAPIFGIPAPVRRPTLAMIDDRTPASGFVPLRRDAVAVGGATTTVHVTFTGPLMGDQQQARQFARLIQAELDKVQRGQ